MSELIFKYCPICSGRLESGNLIIPYGRSVAEYVWWYSEKKVVVKHINECIGVFPMTSFRKIRKSLDIPAGYCKKCQKILAEFEVTNEI